jgi:GNAT superfamily N-acetyltransferase
MQPDMSVVIAGEADAVAIAGLRTAVAADLTVRFGAGPWSNAVTDRGVLWHMRHGDVLVARDGDAIIGTLALARRKPWAIDPAYFTRVKRPLHLTSMAILPARQRAGVGRILMAAAEAQARRDGFEAIRLDAYQGAAGAGPFYMKCGYADRGRAVYRETPLIYFEKLLPAASITCPAGRSSASRQPRR